MNDKDALASRLTQTNLGRQIAGRLNHRRRTQPWARRRVAEGYTTTSRSPLVWPGDPEPEQAPSEFPAVEGGLERLRRLREKLSQQPPTSRESASAVQRQRRSEPASSPAAQPSPRTGRRTGPASPGSPQQPPGSPARRRGIVEELPTSSTPPPRTEPATIDRRVTQTTSDPRVPAEEDQNRTRKQPTTAPSRSQRQPPDRGKRHPTPDAEQRRDAAREEHAQPSPAPPPKKRSAPTRPPSNPEVPPVPTGRDADTTPPGQPRSVQRSPTERSAEQPGDEPPRESPPKPLGRVAEPAEPARPLGPESQVETPAPSPMAPAVPEQPPDARPDDTEPPSAPAEMAEAIEKESGSSDVSPEPQHFQTSPPVEVQSSPGPQVSGAASSSPGTPDQQRSPGRQRSIQRRQQGSTSFEPGGGVPSAVRRARRSESGEDNAAQHSAPAAPSMPGEKRARRLEGATPEPAPDARQRRPPPMNDSHDLQEQPARQRPASQGPAESPTPPGRATEDVSVSPDHSVPTSVEPPAEPGVVQRRQETMPAQPSDPTPRSEGTVEPAALDAPAAPPRSTVSHNREQLPPARPADDRVPVEKPAVLKSEVDGAGEVTPESPSASQSVSKQETTRVDAETLLEMAANAQENRRAAKHPEFRPVNDTAPGRAAQTQVTVPPAGRDAGGPMPRNADVGEQPAVVQRRPTDEAESSDVEPPASTASEPAVPEAGAPEPYDVDAMAREVYQILRRRLRVEQERARGWR